MDTLDKKWYHYAILFFIFCVIGWIYELIWFYAAGDGLVNRGFLFGPYLPIYGIGILALYFCLRKLIKKETLPSILAVFLVVMIIVTVVEFSGSVFLEKCFNLELWNYDDHPLNLQGRISLPNSVCLSCGAMIILYYIWPVLEKMIAKLKQKPAIILAVILCSVMSVDFIITLVSKLAV